MNKMIRGISLAVFAMAVLALPSWGANALYSEVQDTGPAFVLYNGDDSAMTLVVTTNGAAPDMTFTVDGNANTVDGSGNTDTIAEFTAALLACTNASGATASSLGLRVDTKASLLTDSTDGELLDGTYVAAANGGTVEVLWDTSAAKFFSVYIPSQDANAIPFGYINPGGTITRITGQPGGTGSATTSVYIDRTLVFQEVSTTGTTHTINYNTEVAIPFKSSEAVIIRQSRATTATTGVLSATVVTP